MKDLKIRARRGFTLIELVVVIAILGILAGLAIPRFLDATATARGAKIVADMRTLESAETIYYAKMGQYPTSVDADFSSLVQGGWPTPPTGTAMIAHTIANLGKTTTVTNATAYTYTKGTTTAEPGKITVDGTITGNGKAAAGTLQSLLGGDN